MKSKILLMILFFTFYNNNGHNHSKLTKTLYPTVEKHESSVANVVAICQGQLVFQLTDTNSEITITPQDVDAGSFGILSGINLSINQSTFDCSKIGSNEVTLTVTDDSGNSDTCTTAVIIQDVSPPTITCPPDITITAELGQSTAFVNVPQPNIFSDNCNVEQLEITRNGPFTPLLFQGEGINSQLIDTPTTISNASFTESDVILDIMYSGNFSSLGECLDLRGPDGSQVFLTCNTLIGCSTVVSSQVEIPQSLWNSWVNSFGENLTFIVQANPNVQDLSCLAVQERIELSATYSIDTLPTNNYNNTANASGTYPVGETIVTWFILDTSGNPGLCSQTITVLDNTPTVAVCQDITLQLSGLDGQMSILAQGLDGGSTSASGSLNFSASQTNFDCSDIGTNEVTLTVTDADGNTDSCTALVTVEEVTLPMLGCQPDITVTSEIDALDAFVNIPQPSFSDNCGLALEEETIDGPFTPLNFNGTGIGSQLLDTPTTISNVNFSDSDVTLNISFSGPFDGTNDCFDLRGPDGSQLFILCDTFGITCDQILNETVTISQSLWNSWVSTYGTDLTFTVLANAGVPDLSCGGVTPRVELSVTYGIEAPPINDYNGTTDASDTYPIGDTVVTWSISDRSGNTRTCEQTITVIESFATEAVCQDITLQLSGLDGQVSILAQALDGGSTSANGSLNFSASQTNFDCSDIGTNEVTLTVTDADGNTDSCTALVTVEDVTLPTLACQPDIIVDAEIEESDAFVSIPLPNGFSDNCGLALEDLTINGPFTPLNFDGSGIGSQLLATHTTISNVSSSDSDVVLNITYSGSFGVSTNCFELNGPDSSQIFLNCGTGEVCGIIQTDEVLIPQSVWNNWVTVYGQNLTFEVQPNTNVSDLSCGGVLEHVELSVTYGVEALPTNDYNGTTDASDTYPIGDTVVTWSISDSSGNTRTCTQTITVIETPNPVSFTAPDDLCIDAGIQTGLGGGLPTGGVYSGPGVIDDGNGTTYTFDPSIAGTGLHSITYTLQEDFTQLGTDIDGEASLDQSGWSVDVSSDGNVLAIGANFNDGNGTNSGHVRIYHWNGTAWTQRGSDIDGGVAFAQSGFSVSLSADGNTVAVGAPFSQTNGDVGRVRVLDWDGTTWNQRGLNLRSENDNGQNGRSVDLSADGNRIAIGAPASSIIPGFIEGHVRIHEWNGTSWVQLGADINGLQGFDRNGLAVALSSNGNRVVMGAPTGYTDDSGYTRVFEWNGATWDQLGATINGTSDNDLSGTTTSMSSDGNTIAIGAPFFVTNSGQVRIFDWDGSAWIQRGTDIVGNFSEQSARSIALSSDGNTIAVGAPFGNQDSSGKVRLYFWNGSSWVLTNEINGENALDRIGWSLALSIDGNRIAFGALGDDTNNSPGHVRVYNRVETGNASDTIEVFALPEVSFTTPVIDECSNDTIITGLDGGLPTGGVYNGNGVTDDGNGQSFSIDTSITGTGDSTVTYTFTDANGCSNSTSVVISIGDDTNPIIDCPANETVEVDATTLTYELPDYWDTGTATATDNCTNPLTQFTQDPIAGTELTTGTQTITLCATDTFGNENCCDFELEVADNILSIENLDLKDLAFYPNPVMDKLFLSNPNNIKLDWLFIYDLNGRELKKINLKETDMNNVYVDVSSLGSATYFIKIISDKGSVVKKIVKQ